MLLDDDRDWSRVWVYTGKYLDFHSYHPLTHKQAVPRTPFQATPEILLQSRWQELMRNICLTLGLFTVNGHISVTVWLWATTQMAWVRAQLQATFFPFSFLLLIRSHICDKRRRRVNNGYSIIHQTFSQTKSISQTDREPLETTVVIPYIYWVSEPIRRILEPIHIWSHFIPTSL